MSRDALLKQYISACKCSDKILAATPWRVLAVRTPEGIQRLWQWSTFRELLTQNYINHEPAWRIKRLKFHSSFWFLEGLWIFCHIRAANFCSFFGNFPLWTPNNFHPNFGNNSSSPSSNIPSSNIDHRSMNPQISRFPTFLKWNSNQPKLTDFTQPSSKLPSKTADKVSRISCTKRFPSPDSWRMESGWQPIIWGISWNTLQYTNIAGC